MRPVLFKKICSATVITVMLTTATPITKGFVFTLTQTKPLRLAIREIEEHRQDQSQDYSVDQRVFLDTAWHAEVTMRNQTAYSVSAGRWQRR